MQISRQDVPSSMTSLPWCTYPQIYAETNPCKLLFIIFLKTFICLFDLYICVWFGCMYVNLAHTVWAEVRRGHRSLELESQVVMNKCVYPGNGVSSYSAKVLSALTLRSITTALCQCIHYHNSRESKKNNLFSTSSYI